MVISLAVLLIPLAVVVAVFRAPGDEVVEINPADAIAEAQASAAFPVSTPVGLSQRWRPVSARFTGGESGAILRVGYLTPEGGAVQLVESNEPFADLVARELGERVGTGTTVILDNGPWQLFTVRGDERALVSGSPERTMIVVGRASVAELRTLATALT
jgi:hypothetical protein